MFTGLIEATGRVERIESRESGRIFRVSTHLGVELADGESIAVNGVCLTVISRDPAGFVADVSPETLRVTTLGGIAAGRLVNLERPLRADARLGGHFVLGHVDARGQVASLKHEGGFHWLDVTIPPEMAPLVILKGSIAIDGVSLTVASLGADRIGVQVVPFTWTHTAFSASREGEVVNLEADVIGKYVMRIHAAGREIAAAPAGRAQS